MSIVNEFCDEVSWGEVFPGYCLIQGINNLYPERFYTPANGVELRDGRFGLTRINDPVVVFSQEAMLDHTFGITDPVEHMKAIERAGMAQLNAFTQRGRLFHQELQGDFGHMGDLYEALRKDGYRPRVHGFAGLYVCHRLAEHIEKRRHDDHSIYEAVGRRS